MGIAARPNMRQRKISGAQSPGGVSLLSRVVGPLPNGVNDL